MLFQLVVEEVHNMVEVHFILFYYCFLRIKNAKQILIFRIAYNPASSRMPMTPAVYQQSRFFWERILLYVSHCKLLLLDMQDSVVNG